MTEVAKLRSPVIVLNVSGTFNTEDLCPRLTYTIRYVIMLDDSVSVEVMHSLFLLPNGKFQERRHNLNDKPRNKWIEILIGEFDTHSKPVRSAEFSLRCTWQKPTNVGFSIKSVLIEPKLL